MSIIGPQETAIFVAHKHIQGRAKEVGFCASANKGLEYILHKKRNISYTWNVMTLSRTRVVSTCSNVTRKRKRKRQMTPSGNHILVSLLGRMDARKGARP
jgi:hypothetical protein